MAQKFRWVGNVTAGKQPKQFSNDRRGRLLFLTTGTAVFLICARSLAVVVADPGGLAAAQALAANPSYNSVGWVGIREGSANYRGTGVLISPEWVLTAAHNWLSNDVSGLEFHIAGTTYTATPGDWLQHPGWSASPAVSHTQGSDIALFHLSKPVMGVVPATLYGGVAELGALVTLVGAGSAGTAATGPQPNPAPLLYATTNVIDRVIITAPGAMLGFDFDDGSALRNSLTGTAIYDTSGHPVTSLGGLAIQANSSSMQLSWLEGTSAAGDSGGPAFADFGNGPEVVGLVSWGVNPTNASNPYGSG
ncbi:MAG: trypsin-like serine protease, partial [Verrucomicrobia bacterium]|nr:trypsin-like serine protease [Verrucomicrobiota bacterium]